MLGDQLRARSLRYDQFLSVLELRGQLGLVEPNILRGTAIARLKDQGQCRVRAVPMIVLELASRHQSTDQHGVHRHPQLGYQGRQLA